MESLSGAMEIVEDPAPTEGEKSVHDDRDGEVQEVDNDINNEVDVKPPPPPIAKVSFRASRAPVQNASRSSGHSDSETSKHRQKRGKLGENNADSTRRGLLPSAFSSSSEESEGESGPALANRADIKGSNLSKAQITSKSSSSSPDKSAKSSAVQAGKSNPNPNEDAFTTYLECLGSWPDPRLGAQYLWTDALCMRIRAETGCRVRRTNVGNQPLTEITGLQLSAPTRKSLEDGKALIEKVQKGVSLAGKTLSNTMSSQLNNGNEKVSENDLKRKLGKTEGIRGKPIDLRADIMDHRGHTNESKPQRTRKNSYSQSPSRSLIRSGSYSDSRSGSVSSGSSIYSKGRRGSGNFERSPESDFSWPPSHPQELPPPPEDGEEDEHGNMWRVVPNCVWAIRGDMPSELCQQGKVIVLQPHGLHSTRKGPIYVIGETTRVQVVVQVLQAIQVKQPKPQESRWLLDQISAEQKRAGTPTRPVPPPPNPPGKIFKRTFFVRDFIGLALNTQLRWVLDILPKITGVRMVKIESEPVKYKKVALKKLIIEGAANHIAATADMFTMILDCFIDVNAFEQNYAPPIPPEVPSPRGFAAQGESRGGVSIPFSGQRDDSWRRDGGRSWQAERGNRAPHSGPRESRQGPYPPVSPRDVGFNGGVKGRIRGRNIDARAFEHDSSSRDKRALR